MSISCLRATWRGTILQLQKHSRRPPAKNNNARPPPTVWSIELLFLFPFNYISMEFYVHLSSWGVLSALTFGCQLHNLVKRADLETRRAAWHLLVLQRLTAGWESARFDLLWSVLAASLDRWWGMKLPDMELSHLKLASEGFHIKKTAAITVPRNYVQ